MRCYDIQIVDEHICKTDPSQKVLDSWVRIKRDSAEALKPSHKICADIIEYSQAYQYKLDMGARLAKMYI
jgi:hypothetical protein